MNLACRILHMFERCFVAMELMLFMQAFISAIYVTLFSSWMEIYDVSNFYFMDIFLQIFNKRDWPFCSCHMLYV